MNKQKNIKTVEQFLKSNADFLVAMKIKIVDNEVILRDYENWVTLQKADIENTKEVESLLENAKIDFVTNEITIIQEKLLNIIKSIEQENKDFICSECLETKDKLKSMIVRLNMLSDYMIFKW